MRMMRLLMIGSVLALAACSGEKGVRVLSKTGDGPDEFVVVPGKPLVQPENYAALPPPTPGGRNLSDQDPLADAVVALGGSAAARSNTSSVGRADTALINYTSRNGRQADIRRTVAAEDEAFRVKRGRFSNIRIVRQDRYNELYRRETLRSYDEWWRWRRAGVRTPAAPPGE
ncbi:DUF3035 domain-containing protein [Shimia abyssi]|uniref:Beta-barrel assembly complex subunit BamF n=1 Tax=Shimia abyssi TaxID=1662395 RepID=A0A2P8F9Y8_9RHOB|nr:DUF3035 domain-containing protein [Shimia abyssi]PSL18515.1 beta-barrel assembly complex subunit BamF [Shimia abyssi]